MSHAAVVEPVSDLLCVCGPGRALIGYTGGSPARRSEITDEQGHRLPPGATLQVHGLTMDDAVNSPARYMEQLAGNVDLEVVPDPADLLLDELVEIEGEHHVQGLLHLPSGSYLLPISTRAIELLGLPAVLEAGSAPSSVDATLQAEEDGGAIVVRLTIPIQRGRQIRVHRQYKDAAIQCWQHTPCLAVWPNFRSEDWKENFLYQRGAPGGVYLSPCLGGDELAPDYQRSRVEKSVSSWWRTEAPVEYFIARDRRSQGRELGLMTGPYVESVGRARQDWRVSVDFGSTNTRVFRLHEGEISPLPIVHRTRLLAGSGLQDDEFFRWEGYGSEQEQDDAALEIPTQVVVPKEGRAPEREGSSPWLPADGLAVLGRLGADFHFASDSMTLSSNIKWSLEDTGGGHAKLFLSHLLILLRTEAARHEARVRSIAYAFPSAFPRDLQDATEDRWRRLLHGAQVEDEGGEVEAESVAKYLVHRQKATLVTRMLAVDVGGSTADIAVWKANKVATLNSIRFAASAISAYWCVGENWGRYCSLLEQVQCDLKVNGNNELQRVDLGERIPYFHLSLEALERKQLVGDFIRIIARDGRDSQFLHYVLYVYGVLVYYLGLLARETLAEEDQSSASYVLYFCGKGSYFLDWIHPDGEWETLQELFISGAKLQGVSPEQVELKVGDQKKCEVGYGRLVESGLTGQRRRRRGRGSDPWPVRVGEEGYLSQGALDTMTLKDLETIAEDGVRQVPAQFVEMQRFVDAFANSGYPFQFAGALKGFREAFLQRLSGNIVGCVNYELRQSGPDAVTLDPMLILQSKVLAERYFGLPQSVWHGLENT